MNTHAKRWAGKIIEWVDHLIGSRAIEPSRANHAPLVCYIAAAAFMLFGAGHYTLFDDEALSCRLYALPMGTMLTALWNGEDPDPPLYYIIQNVWVHVAGVGPFAMRIPSIVFLICGVVLLRRAATEWFGEMAGVLCAMMTALHPAHLFFGFAARWYSLMFLLTALLLRLSAPRAENKSTTLRRQWAWSLCAAALCYTNYFGGVIVGLVWLVMAARHRRERSALTGMIFAGIFALLFFLPWMPPFWHHVVNFARPALSLQSVAASTARLGLTLTSGNLAGPAAYWVWAPAAAAMILLGVHLAQNARRFAAPAFMALGATLIGIGSRTLIDKYIMTLSGPMLLLLAGLLSRYSTAPRADVAAGDDPPKKYRFSSWPSRRSPECVAGCLIVLAWVGCMVNLVTERNWSSLRWLDPFESVTRALYESNWEHTRPDAVCSHPSARYYFALHRVLDSNRSAIEKSMEPDWIRAPIADADEWLAAYNEQEDPAPSTACFALTPEAAAARWAFNDDRPMALMTLETAGFIGTADWATFRAFLALHYMEISEPAHYLADADAAWKDRLDPGFSHPAWRITVRTWKRRE